MLKLKMLTVVFLSMILCCSPALAEGRAYVSYEKIFSSKIKENYALKTALSAFDIQDVGTAQAIVGDNIEWDFPCAFAARLKGSSGKYEFIILIDRVKDISCSENRFIVGERRIDQQALGIAILPLKEPIPF